MKFEVIKSMLTGKKIDGVWHTSIVVYGREYFFGSRGVESCDPVSSGENTCCPKLFIDWVSNVKSKFGSRLKIVMLQQHLLNYSVIIRVCLCRSSETEFLPFQGSTALHEPVQKIKLGETQVPHTIFIDYLGGLSQSTYA